MKHLIDFEINHINRGRILCPSNERRLSKCRKVHIEAIIVSGTLVNDKESNKVSKLVAFCDKTGR